MKEINKILGYFGFSEIEAEIYATALTLKRPSTSEIAIKMDKPRTAIYFHIKNLVRKGLLKESKIRKSFYYVATPPSELGNTLDHWITDFKSLLPQLENLSKIEDEKPIVEVSESKRGYFKIYEELSTLPPKSTFRVIEGSKAMKLELTLFTDEEWEVFFRRVCERKIETRAIFTKEAIKVAPNLIGKENYKFFQNRIWHLRSLPEEQLPLHDLVFIYKNKVAFLFPETSLVVTITHREIAKALTAIFDALFMFASPEISAWK